MNNGESQPSLAQFVSDLAHEVRNPLFGITAGLEVLELELEDGAQHELITAVRGNAERLTRLMTDVVDLTRAELDPMQPVDLGRVIRSAVGGLFKQAAADHAVVITVALPDGAIPRLGRESRLLRAFRNLVENAIQFSPTGGSIEVTAALVSGCLEVRITDMGAGLTAEALAHTFQPFFSLRKGGVGLGLALTKKIIADHGGEVTLVNGVRGAVATVRLPVEEVV